MSWENSFFAGVLSWGVIREILGFVFKEWLSGRKAKYKVLSDEAAALIPLIDTVVNSSVQYYSVAGNNNYELSTSIKVGIAQIGRRYSDLSKRLEGLNKTGLNTQKLISFRKAVTWDLDSTSRPAWGLSNYGLTNILESSANIREELNNSRFDIAR